MTHEVGSMATDVELWILLIFACVMVASVGGMSVMWVARKATKIILAVAVAGLVAVATILLGIALAQGIR